MDAGFCKRLDLLAAAAEHKGVASLQPEHALAFFGELDEFCRDLLLRQNMVVWQLADINVLGFAAHEVGFDAEAAGRKVLRRRAA